MPFFRNDDILSDFSLQHSCNYKEGEENLILQLIMEHSVLKILAMLLPISFLL